MRIGLERELVGRFNTYIHTNNYNKEALKNIARINYKSITRI